MNTLPIVHVASHGEFGNDVGNTFSSPSMTNCRSDRSQSDDRCLQVPVMIRWSCCTLSACDTAAGDDRAALGLAGMAIKAGARSALATLWNINDAPSVDLVVDFYRELKDTAISRAVALQRAQIELLEQSTL